VVFTFGSTNHQPEYAPLHKGDEYTVNERKSKKKIVSRAGPASPSRGRRIEPERERDRVQRGLVLDVQYRDCQPSPQRLPIESEKRTALTLDGDGLFDELTVHVLVKLDHEATPCLLDEPRAPSSAAVALELQAQPGLVQGATRCHRQRLHTVSIRRLRQMLDYMRRERVQK
jgi:hypothetical protein